MKFILFLALVFLGSNLQAAQIFHLKQKKRSCQWKLYDVDQAKDKKYFETQNCPDQIVWLKDKSFYFSIKSEIFWANQWTQKPIKIVNYKTARKGHAANSEVIWGVKGKYNSIYTLVIDPDVHHQRVNKDDIYTYKEKKLNSESFRGVATEPKAAGIIRIWLKGKKKWKTVQRKVVGRYNPNHFDEDLYNNSVLSSRQIVNYNECSAANCEKLPSDSYWSKNSFEKKLKLNDNGMESMGYLSLGENKGLLFKKSFDENLHPVKPFLLCEDNCEKTKEIELPSSFSDNFAMVKKGSHLLLFNENRGSVGSLYSFNSAKPVKNFKGPMVFWHPF